MKLLFLCTSLEPGRDGVGDYVRLLAEACVENGHDCQLVAVNDEHIARGGIEQQRGRSVDLRCMRLSPSERWDERFAAVQSLVHAFNPDWLSWNIVPYGFHPKGLIPPELAGFGRLGRDRSVHVMLHELWIGLSRGEPLKNIAWGALQKRRLMHFLRALNPTVTHTSNATYEAVLAREGCHSQVLPLFGNISITEIVPQVPRPGEWIGGIFGTVHPQFPPVPCFDVLLEGAKASGRRLRMLGIGRMGTYGEQMFAALNEEYGEDLQATVVGEKTPAEVSRLLQTLDFGIATHPWALIGKSGAVAAMIDHGLPVVVPRDDWELRTRPIEVPSIDKLVFKLSEMPPELMAGRLARKSTPSARLPGIAYAFIESLVSSAASLQYNA
ncbi:hypothetical protein DB347_13745 [Opitutaceae bacterium EW11]|nr:hypothetical protein DB347_13745 [Opitutaceae bacterium EW11]